MIKNTIRKTLMLFLDRRYNKVEQEIISTEEAINSGLTSFSEELYLSMELNALIKERESIYNKIKKTNDRWS